MPQSRLFKRLTLPKSEDQVPRSFVHALPYFQGKWTPFVIHSLYKFKRMSQSQLKEKLHPISPSMLAKTLQRLLADEIIEIVHDEHHPSRKFYQLTEKGCMLIPIYHLMCRWAGCFVPAVRNAHIVHSECRTCPVRNGFQNPLDIRYDCPCENRWFCLEK